MLYTLIAIRSRAWIRTVSIGALEVAPTPRRALLLLLCLLAAVTLTPQYVVQAAPPSQSPDEGKTIYDQQCAGCHAGGVVGPDLAGVTDRRDSDWLTRWILEPDKMLAENDPIATELLAQFNNVAMPNLGLTSGEVASVVAYLETQAGAPAQAVIPAPVAATTDGDPGIGKRLFTGTKSLKNGGPSCIACHAITGIGAFGGGALGPDLTGSYEKLGGALISWPQSTPPMAAIFAEKPLTADEQDHLLAFIQSASVPERDTQAVWQLAGLSVAGVVVVIVLIQLVWRRRLGNVRSPMVSGE
ncbi:MAG: c-type cytochrome [SAR202 cluster bacterium]|nr:c-type cytochrome [SAR202 cluster bacterium]